MKWHCIRTAQLEIPHRVQRHKLHSQKDPRLRYLALFVAHDVDPVKYSALQEDLTI
jgi:hypothetical protein